MKPEEFPRRFASAFAARDIEALTGLFQEDATILGLTGFWAETPEELHEGLAGEAAGIFRNARLVTGKGSLRDLGANASLLRQRYMISGALDEAGTELPRFAAMLVAVMERADEGWLVQSMTFTALP
jgi:ketosteroid isomerase-like protein